MKQVCWFAVLKDRVLFVCVCMETAVGDMLKFSTVCSYFGPVHLAAVVPEVFSEKVIRSTSETAEPRLVSLR